MLPKNATFVMGAGINHTLTLATGVTCFVMHLKPSLADNTTNMPPSVQLLVGLCQNIPNSWR